MPELRPESLIFWSHLDPAARKSLYARHHRGEIVRLHHGAFVESDVWDGIGEDARHRGKALAVAIQYGDDFVFSHLTAAALWRLPRMGAWPIRPHVAGAIGGGSTTASFIRHGLGLPGEVETIDDLSVTTLSASVVDVAATVGFAHGVVIADAALHRSKHPVTGVPRTHLSPEQLLAELPRLSQFHGAAKARRVVEFADGRADRPGESMSRASMHIARVSAPELQVRMLGASGTAYVVDFWWPQYNTIGEFDGKYKYTDPEYMGGRNAQQVLYDEKVREDDLRAASHGFTRWPWATAVSPTLMRAHLRRAGVH